jgi:hypothetical protein
MISVRKSEVLGFTQMHISGEILRRVEGSVNRCHAEVITDLICKRLRVVCSGWRDARRGSGDVAIVSPWRETRDPARDVSEIGLVFGTECFAKRRFLVKKHEEMRCKPGNNCVDEEVGVAQKERLAEDQRCHRDVHGISYEAVGALDDEVLCGEDGCGRPDALQSEAREGFEYDGDAGGNESDSDDAKRSEV